MSNAAPDNGVDSQWVVVTYADDETMPISIMDALKDTELEASAALDRTGVGFMDGNDIGDGEYQLYFGGQDREAVWRIVQPILDRAPVKWDKATLSTSNDDDDPTVLVNADPD